MVFIGDIYICSVSITVLLYRTVPIFTLHPDHQPIFYAYFQHLLWNIRLETLEAKVEMHLIYWKNAAKWNQTHFCFFRSKKEKLWCGDHRSWYVTACGHERHDFEVSDWNYNQWVQSIPSTCDMVRKIKEHLCNCSLKRPQATSSQLESDGWRMSLFVYGLGLKWQQTEENKWRVSSTCEELFRLKRKHEIKMNISVPCTWFSTSVHNYIISLCSSFAMWCWIETPISFANFLEL